MSHVLVIKDASGKEIARVPVEHGWTITEIKDAPKQVGVGDKAKASEKAGS